MLERNIKPYLYAPTTSIEQALHDLYRRGVAICLVCDPRRKLLGILTLSDIKRALLKGVDSHAPLKSIMITDFTSAPSGTSLAELKKLAKIPTRFKTGILAKIPLLDKAGRVTGLYTDSKDPARASHTVLVTGGAGYMGSLVCRYLLKDGYRVVVLDKLLFSDAGIRDLYSNKNFRHIHGDTGDTRTLMEAIHDADSVIHLAGLVGDPACALDPMQTMEENHFGTKMLINLCQYYHVSRFIFASSCSVYGSTESRSTEESALRPVSLYAHSKVYSEREILKTGDASFHPVILRFGTLYGYSPRMRFDLVVNTMTARAYFDKRITVQSGEAWRPLIHADDAARALVSALKAPLQLVSGEIFNVGSSSENYQIGTIAREVQKHLPKTTIEHQSDVKDRRDYHVSFDKIRKVLKFKTRHTLATSIGDIIKKLKTGAYDDWGSKKYSNYLTLQSQLKKKG